MDCINIRTLSPPPGVIPDLFRGPVDVPRGCSHSGSRNKSGITSEAWSEGQTRILLASPPTLSPSGLTRGSLGAAGIDPRLTAEDYDLADFLAGGVRP